MGLFITFEGVEGCGKSTQARLLYEHIHESGYPVILVREPGGTRISDTIRHLVLDLRHTEMTPMTEILLFAASRAQLVGEVIRPYLAHGGIVLCDRYADSTYAYQGYGLGRDLDELRMITKMATGDLQPDLTLYLSLSAEEGLERKHLRRQSNGYKPQGTEIRDRGGASPRAAVEWNRLDARELAFHKRVESGYRQMIAQSPERWRVLDARQSIEALADEIIGVVEPLLSQVRRLEQL